MEDIHGMEKVHKKKKKTDYSFQKSIALKMSKEIRIYKFSDLGQHISVCILYLLIHTSKTLKCFLVLCECIFHG